MADKIEPNVTREGKIIQIKRVFIEEARASYTKRRLVLSFSLALDESSFSIKDELALYKLDETPIALTLRPILYQPEMPGISSGDFGTQVLREVAQKINKDPHMHAQVVDHNTGEIIDEDGDEDS